MQFLVCFQALHIKKHNLDSRNLLDDSKRLLWLRENYTKILELLDEELIVMNKMPFFVKTVWVLSYFNLIGEFNRVKFYDFKFGVELKKEIKTMISTIHMGIQIFVKVFF